MCDERERLIEYVYDDVDPDERAAVESHVNTCVVCQEEIRGLRQVREELRNWDVPDHDPIWRPIVPIRTAPTWRDIPAWMMAAAAGLVMISGVTGGVVARAWPAGAPAAVAAVEPAAPAAQPVAVSTDDLDRLERRLRADFTSQLEDRVTAIATLASHQVAAAPAQDVINRQAAAIRELRAKVQEQESWLARQADINVYLNNRIGRLAPTPVTLGARSDAARFQPVGFDGVR